MTTPTLTEIEQLATDISRLLGGRVSGKLTEIEKVTGVRVATLRRAIYRRDLKAFRTDAGSNNSPLRIRASEIARFIVQNERCVV